MTTECETWPIVGYTPPEGYDPELYDLAVQAAQAFLVGVTMGRFGSCTHTQRFQVRQTKLGVCATPLPSGHCCAIRLPNTPIQRIDAVRVDGVLLVSSGYHLLGGTRLGRAGCCWPQGDGFGTGSFGGSTNGNTGGWPQSPDCVPGRVEVTYTSGVSLAPGSAYYAMAGAAMGEMVREYMAAFTTGLCKLPSRFVTVARQGITVQALDPALFLDFGMTGLPLTDFFIRTVNPNGLRRRPRVVSIDGPRRN